LVLKELYEFYLDEKDQATCSLIERYWKILPYKFIKKYNNLQCKGKTQGKKQLEFLTYQDNPFLNLIKNPSCSDKYTSIYIKYQNDTNK
jgi:hypothetical protein